MALFETISEDIKAAMKARDKVRLDTLRNIKKVFLEAKTAPGANDTLEVTKQPTRSSQQVVRTSPTWSWLRRRSSRNIYRNLSQRLRLRRWSRR